MRTFNAARLPETAQDRPSPPKKRGVILQDPSKKGGLTRVLPQPREGVIIDDDIS